MTDAMTVYGPLILGSVPFFGVLALLEVAVVWTRRAAAGATDSEVLSHD